MPELGPSTDTNHYARIATALHELADQLVTIAESETAALYSVYLSIGEYGTARHLAMAKAVDQVAAAFGEKAATVFEGRGANRRGERIARFQRGPVNVRIFTTVPAPPTRAQKLADLQRENDELRAKLANGGEQA